MGHRHWPLFDLEIRTPRVTLRTIDDELGLEVAEVIEAGIHDPSWTPFAMPWTDVAPEVLGRSSFQFWWRCRATLTPQDWNLNLAVIEDGRVVGASGIGAKDFPTLRWFETGSWLGREHQGRGLGTELRVATLHLGFLGLDGEVAGTGAYADNGPSLGVTRKLGYEANGIERHVRRNEIAEIHKFRMTREHFDAHVHRDDIELVGDAAARDLLAISR